MAKKPTRKPSPPLDKQADAVPIHFNVPVNRSSLYATNLLIQPGEHEVIVSFYEIVPPFLTTNSNEEALAILKKTGVRADCVARITIATERFEAFAEAMKKAASDLKSASKRMEAT